MDTNTITLDAHETALLVEAVGAASSVYHRAATKYTPGVPAFSVDDQPATQKASVDAVLSASLMLTLYGLRALKHALTQPRETHPMVVELDMDDFGKDVVTIRRGERPDDAISLLMQAVFNANVKIKPGRKTMALLERLM